MKYGIFYRSEVVEFFDRFNLTGKVIIRYL